MTPIKFFLDDPAYPELVRTAAVPEQSSMLPFDVVGFVEGEYPLDTERGRAGNCYAAVAHGIDRYLRIRPEPIHWAKVRRLEVRPAAGKTWNAFYDRRNLQFFFNWDEVRRRMVFAASSPAIVLHELGHGILDAIRPDLWSYSGMFEVWALHEAFGDIFSFACTLAHDEVLGRALADTGGDLGKTNIVSGIAEEFNAGLSQLPTGQLVPLRDATRFFAYVDPATLPKTGPRDQLTREVHSFSRVFSGMVYDFFLRIYREKSAAMPPFQAAREAMDVVVGYVVQTAPLVAVRADFFDSFARCMMFIDFREGQRYFRHLNAACAARNVLHDVKVQEAEPEPVGDQRVYGAPGRQLHVFPRHGTVVVARERLADARGHANPLYGLEVDVASDRHREYDRFQNLAIDDYANHRDTVNSVAVTLDVLHDGDLVGDKLDQPFRVSGNKLIRKHFACR